MEKSTLVEILRTLSKDELAGFGDFVSSPYFNKKSNVTKLYKALRKFAPGYPAVKITKEEMWKSVFPGKAYNYGIMKNLIYDLNGLAIKFLEIENHTLETVEGDINLLKQYKLRSLKSLFARKLLESRNKLAVSEIDNSTLYYSYLLENIELAFLDYDYHLKTTKYDFSNMNKYLASFYFSSFFYDNINNIQNSLSMDVQLDNGFHLNMIEQYQKFQFRNAYTDTIYFAYKTVFEHYSEDNYYKFKSLFFENYAKFTKNLQYNLAAFLLNFCKNNNYRDRAKFAKEEFVYVRLIIENRLYKHTGLGWLDQYMYIASFVSACRADEMKWGEKFIENYKKELSGDIREQYYCYAQINLNIRKHDYPEALKYFSRCNNVDGRDKLSIRSFGFLIYYELDYYDELKSLADTTSHVIRNDKLFSLEDKIQLKNYIFVVCKLMDYKFNVGKKKNDKDFPAAITKFVTENPIRHKAWVLNKTKELTWKNI